MDEPDGRFGTTAPAGRIACSAGEAHVWPVRVDELAVDDRSLRACLSDEELDRADRFRFRRDASRFVRRRWVLRRLLAAYGADPARAALATGPNGKPEAPGGGPLRCSVSSSGGMVVVALATYDLGVDLERLRVVPDRDLLIRSTMSGEEQATLAGESGGDDEAFLRLWTVKEAYMKALGTGLTLDPLEVRSTVAGPGRWNVSAPGVPGSPVVALDVGGPFVASLAVPRHCHTRVRMLAVDLGCGRR